MIGAGHCPARHLTFSGDLDTNKVFTSAAADILISKHLRQTQFLADLLSQESVLQLELLSLATLQMCLVHSYGDVRSVQESPGDTRTVLGFWTLNSLCLFSCKILPSRQKLHRRHQQGCAMSNVLLTVAEKSLSMNW